MKNKCEKYITKNNLWDTQMLKEKYPASIWVYFEDYYKNKDKDI